MCSICKEFILSQSIVGLGCGHAFHLDCLAQFHNDNGDHCPDCEEPIQVMHKVNPNFDEVFSMLRSVDRFTNSIGRARDNAHQFFGHLLGIAQQGNAAQQVNAVPLANAPNNPQPVNNQQPIVNQQPANNLQPAAVAQVLRQQRQQRRDRRRRQIRRMLNDLIARYQQRNG